MWWACSWKPGHIVCLGIRPALGSVAELFSPLLWEHRRRKPCKPFPYQLYVHSSPPSGSRPCAFSSANMSTQQLSATHRFLILTPVFNLWAFVHVSHRVNHLLPILHKLQSPQLKRPTQVPSLPCTSWIPKKWHLPALSPCPLSHSIITLCLELDCAWLLSSAKL